MYSGAVPDAYVVSYRNSTSNHNVDTPVIETAEVVSYRNSTSNHNLGHCSKFLRLVVSYRNSTSNHNTLTPSLLIGTLYLIEILHQTTTFSTPLSFRRRCILSKFYIKPQLWLAKGTHKRVVSYRNSTSNHNEASHFAIRRMLYLIEILHQTTTSTQCASTLLSCILSKFYIKPQPLSRMLEWLEGCILSKFYIKPQPGRCYCF